jgi:hypothetical protein
MKIHLSLGAIVIGLLSVTTLSHAQSVTWGAATSMSDDSDVSNTGAYFDAGTFYGTATTVNGVAFNPLTNTGDVFSDGSGKISVSINNVLTPGSVDNGLSGGPTGSVYLAYTGGSTNYQNVVSTLGFTNSGVGTGMTVTLSDLTIGNYYQVQVWAFDGKSENITDVGTDSENGVNRITTELTGANNVLINGSPLPTTPEIGQFALGNFTATSTTETFQALQTQTGDVVDAAVINDVSVRDFGVIPEPSQVCLFGMGLAMLAVVMRRRRVANR